MSEDYMREFNDTCDELSKIFNENLNKDEIINQTKNIINNALEQIAGVKRHNPLKSKILIEMFSKKLNSLNLPYPTELKYRMAVIYFAYENSTYKAKEIFEDIWKNEKKDLNWKELSGIYLIKIFTKFLSSDFSIIDINEIKNKKEEIENYLKNKNDKKEIKDELVSRSWHEELNLLNDKIYSYDNSLLVRTNSRINDEEKNKDMDYLLKNYPLVINAKGSPLYEVFFYGEKINLTIPEITLLRLIIRNYTDYDLIEKLELSPKVKLNNLEEIVTNISNLFISGNSNFEYEFERLYDEPFFKDEKKDIELAYTKYLESSEVESMNKFLKSLILKIEDKLGNLDKLVKNSLEQRIKRLKDKLRELNPEDVIIRVEGAYQLNINAAILTRKELEFDDLVD